MTNRNVKRSAIYHLLNTIAPTNHKHKAETDIWGSVLAVALAFGVAAVARIILFSSH